VWSVLVLLCCVCTPAEKAEQQAAVTGGRWQAAVEAISIEIGVSNSSKDVMCLLCNWCVTAEYSSWYASSFFAVSIQMHLTIGAAGTVSAMFTVSTPYEAATITAKSTSAQSAVCWR
jgi:hypothetical protein